MKHLKNIVLMLIFLFTAGFCLAVSPKEIVKKGDEILNAPKDAYILNTMEITEKDGTKSIRESEMFQKGTDMRLIRFLSPADQRGIAFLTLPNEIMYLYLPAFHKIRQIASHVKNQNFAGTDLTYDDLSSFEVSKTHTAEFVREEDTMYVLKLTPLDPKGKDYEYLHIYYLKDNYYPVKTEYYDRSGNLWKILERKELKQINNYWISMELEVRDVKNDHTTISKVEKIDLDIGLDDSVFSKRNLIRIR